MQDRQLDFHQEYNRLLRYKLFLPQPLQMQELYELIDKLAPTESTVLITGEDGTGKELVARAIHARSLRNETDYVIRNCSAFNENLLESELFGHIKGSFTGADRDRIGVFEAADGGTLFLDEVGDTSPAMQVKLLRVLQDGTFVPVGAAKSRSTDVRLVAATTRTPATRSTPSISLRSVANSLCCTPPLRSPSTLRADTKASISSKNTTAGAALLAKPNICRIVRSASPT